MTFLIEFEVDVDEMSKYIIIIYLVVNKKELFCSLDILATFLVLNFHPVLIFLVPFFTLQGNTNGTAHRTVLIQFTFYFADAHFRM